MHIKKLIGEKCYLSPMDINDAERFAVWLNDLEVTLYTKLAPQSLSIESEKGILSSLCKEHNYSIIDKLTNQLIGSCGLLDIDHINQTAEIGIIIGDKNFWNRGYGSEALHLLLNYAFKYLNLFNIMLRVYSANEKGINCYEKIGFKKIGERRKALIRNLQVHNIILMDIIPEDFYKTN
ncbi:MAG: GNAT family protein [Spirochaetota bacterium]